ncbi:TPA: DUF6236 family protein [Klebsiella michiganensis]
MKLIQSAGLVEKHMCMQGLVSGSIPNILNKAYKNKTFELLNDKEHNYATYNMEHYLRNGKQKSKDTSNIQSEIITLANSLPLPDESTDLEKIIEFRDKRADELRQLLIHLNSLDIRIASAENQDLELKRAINEIDLSCSTIIRLFNENKIQHKLTSIDCNINMKDILKVVAATYAGASIFLPQTAAQAISIASGVVSVFSVKSSIKINKIDSQNPFNYVGYISKEL